VTDRDRDERDARLFLTDALAAARARLSDGADPDTSTYFMAVFVTLAAGALYPDALREGVSAS